MLPAGAEGVDDSGGIDERRAGGIGDCGEHTQEANGPVGLVDAGTSSLGKSCAIDTGTPVVYLTDACSGSTQEYEDVATAMMEFASPTHAAVMTCKEYTALRQG